MRKRIGICLLALTTVIGLVGCSTGSGGAEGGTFRKLYSAEVSTLNYLTTVNTVDYGIAANVIDCLVDHDQYGNIKPGLAESWESNKDMTVWTFHLRDDVKWVDSNGKEVADVTAKDWVAAARYINDAANDADTQYMYSTGAQVKNAQAYYDYTEYMMLSENGTRTTDEEGNALEPVDEVKAEDIGVVAKDDHTLVYYLESPCSFFPSVTSITSYMPVSQKYLDKWGDKFASDKDHMLYCGAYTLTKFKENKEQVLTRNESYWDKENVHIDEIQNTYDKDMAYHEPYMFLDDKLDYAKIPEDLREDWMNDEEKSSQIHTQRPNYAYSYFYCFNFDPKFDAQYEPENWKKAVENENFRQALMAGLDRKSAIAVKDPTEPEMYVQNTITPDGFAAAAGKDFTDYDALTKIMKRDSFDEDQAVAYKEKAMEELKAEGVQFPVKILMPYNPALAQWREECYEVEEQMEDALGKDFIDITVEEGPETDFLEKVRRSGKFAFMKCNWGADYVDPETWSQPFMVDNTYMFWDQSENEQIKEDYAKWEEFTKKAAEFNAEKDLDKRYENYAKAEAFLIDHAYVVPFSSFSGDGFIMSRINEFEGGYSPCGVAAERYKYMHLRKDSMSQEEYDAAYEKWKQEREDSLK